MTELTLTLPDGQTVALEAGRPYGDAVRQIGEGLLRNALAVTVDGVHHALSEPAGAGGHLTVITRTGKGGLETLRHSTAHLLAWAVQDLFPGTTFAFGP